MNGSFRADGHTDGRPAPFLHILGWTSDLGHPDRRGGHSSCGSYGLPSPAMSPTARADLMLLVAAVVWGAGFVAQRTGMDHVGPLTFTAARFAIGAMVLIPVALAIR